MVGHIATFMKKYKVKIPRIKGGDYLSRSTIQGQDQVDPITGKKANEALPKSMLEMASARSSIYNMESRASLQSSRSAADNLEEAEADQALSLLMSKMTRLEKFGKSLGINETTTQTDKNDVHTLTSTAPVLVPVEKKKRGRIKL